MSKKAKISIVAGVVLLLVVLLYFFGRAGSEKEGEQEFVSDSWTPTYSPVDRGPYGTFVLKELLDTIGLFGNFIQLQDNIMESLEDHPSVNDIYFFVGPVNHLPDSSTEHLLKFVDNGNTAFLSTQLLPEEMAYELFFNTDEIMNTDIVFDSIQYYKFTHPDLVSKRYKFRYVHNNKTKTNTWYYFDTLNFDLPMGEDPIQLGTNTKGRLNYVKIKYGEGFIYLHSSPYCFTNISMMKRDGFMYAERIMEHIPPGRVQWDRYSLKEHAATSSSGDSDSDNGGEKRRSPLEFIMAHPPLMWAGILLILGALFYAFFKGKRMQKVIPPAELKENTSLEYVNTLSSLYMQQGTHSKLISLKEKTFLNFIAERYFIITQKADEKFIAKVAIKAQVDKEKIGEIFSMFDQLNGAVEVSDDDLILLHKKIEYFYKNCR